MSETERKLLEAAAMILGRDEAERLLQQVKAEFPMEMRLCEQDHVILRANQPYIFTVDPDCAHCRKLDEVSRIPTDFIVMAHRSSGSILGAATAPMKDGKGKVLRFTRADAETYKKRLEEGLTSLNIRYTVEPA